MSEFNTGYEISQSDASKLLSKVNLKYKIGSPNDLDKVSNDEEFKQFFSAKPQSSFRSFISSFKKNDNKIDINNVAGLLLFNGSYHGQIDFTSNSDNNKKYITVNMLDNI